VKKLGHANPSAIHLSRRHPAQVSDLSAAKHADLLFVKDKLDGENDLKDYCDKEGIKHKMFVTFDDVLRDVKSVVEGNRQVAEVLEDDA
jgi:2-hydroxy-3-keto-5-methylthiopentenyl-1-phosphate phosphatase